MLCPIDGTELAVTARQGVQIDVCPRCKGVWLDRGELDKIIDAAYSLPVAPPGQDPPAVGVWADSIQQAPAVPTPAPPSPPPQQPGYPQQPAPPNPVQALSDLLSGLATVHPVNQGHIQPGQIGQRRKPRGWLEQMFDIDLS